MKVLILSARAPVALDWARHFQAASWQVFLADHQAGRLSCQNILPHVFVPTPSAKAKPWAYIQTLIDTINTHRIDCLIPTCEETLYVAYFRHLLPQHCHVLCDAFEQVNQLHNKWQFNQLAQQLGIGAPMSQQLNHHHDRHWHIDKARVIKPLYSRFGHSVQMLKPHQSVPEHLPLNGTWLVQERLYGQEYCSYSIAHQGKLLAHQAYVGVYRYRQGASFYFSSIEHAQIEAQVRHLIETLDFSGQISFDWMVNAQGQAFVLECNPRATSGLHLLEQNGSLIHAITEHQPVPKLSQPKHKMLTSMMLSYALPQALQNGQWRQWQQHMQQANDVLGHWQHHWGSLQDAWYFYRLSRRLNISLEAATAEDFIWDGTFADAQPTT